MNDLIEELRSSATAIESEYPCTAELQRQAAAALDRKHSIFHRRLGFWVTLWYCCFALASAGLILWLIFGAGQ